ncbi:MAG: peptide ABC transporter substrate-binding protein [Chloroflexota bacterium]
MRNRLIGLLASTAIVFAACQGATTSPSATTAPPASAPASSEAPSVAPSGPVDYDQLLYGFKYEPTAGTAGGKVIISDHQVANQLNPYYSNAFVNTEVFTSAMRSLLTVSSDGHWKPDLADGPITYKDNVKVDADGKAFTVHAKLKPNLKWSDGQPLTMNDFKYTWTWVNDAATAVPSKLGWDEVDKVDVSADGLEADFHFKAPFAGWLGTIGGNWPLPEHYMKTIPGKDAAAKSYPVSAELGKAPVSGPFKYVTATPDTIELARNENWAGGDHPAYLDGVTYKFFPENPEGMIAAFLASEIDVALDLLQADYDAIKGVDPSKGKALLEAAWEYEHLDMNQAGLGQGKGHPALKDIVLRKAMAQAIDKKAMYETVFPGAPYPDNNPCTNATPSNYWRLPDAKCLPFDVAAANKALDDAGYTAGADGIRVDPKSKLPLVFEHCTSVAPARVLGGDFLAKSMQAIGVKLNVNAVAGAQVLFADWPDVKADTKCNLAHGNYDTSEFTYVLSFDLYGDYGYSYPTEQIPTDANKGSGYNYLRLSNPDMDAAVTVLKSAVDPKEQVEAAYKLQQVYLDTVPEIVLYYRNSTRGINVKLQNFFKNPSTASDMWNVEDWWLQP